MERKIYTQMKMYLVICSMVLLVTLNPIWAQRRDDLSKETVSIGAHMLFDDDKTTTYYTNQRLQPFQKEWIYQELNLLVDPEKTHLYHRSDKAFAHPLHCTVKIIDLDNDGKLEVIVTVYNVVTTSFKTKGFAFALDGAGRYRKILQARGDIYLSPEITNGYPDLVITGVGGRATIKKWDGKRYRLNEKTLSGPLQPLETISYADYYGQQKANKP